jgi:hypothetical protein
MCFQSKVFGFLKGFGFGETQDLENMRLENLGSENMELDNLAFGEFGMGAFGHDYMITCNADIVMQLLHDCICNVVAAVHGYPTTRTQYNTTSSSTMV